MKRKIIFTFIGLFVFLICFAASVSIRDFFYEQMLRKNIQKIEIGMTEKEVIGILGEPSNRQMSDIEGLYWEYSTDTFNRSLYKAGECPAYLLLQMDSNGKVVKVFGFRD